MNHETLSPETITRLWSEAITRASIEQRSEPHVFAELLLAAASAETAELTAALNRANAATTRAEQERDTLCTALHALSARWRTWADDPSHGGVFLAGAIQAHKQCADDLDAILAKTEPPR